ncbi:MAG: Rieske 2Fe-2S domain-containing protein [Chloroflexi bacterium]|nr:Rieske 2Fe-2S domain-containing protein [Chloroflexota bacterium]
MLSKEDNELLTRVGPGTPMGQLLRHYWIPVVLSEELAGPDGAPMRVRLLGEDLILFRDTSGRVGLLEDHCSHRGASLFFGRNEADGLRCVYHGWKYDVAGACVDMPNEPEQWTGDEVGADAESEATRLGAAPRRFKDKIHHRAYPCREYGGMIWSYLGSRDVPPELPKFEWALLPEVQRSIAPEFIRECNWVQALEGDIDTSHLYFLHARLDPREERGPQNDNGVYHEDRHPRLHLVDTPYGVMYGAQRDEGPDQYYWRITQFLFPFHTLIPPGGRGAVPGHIWVPLDDYHTMRWSVAWDPTGPLSPSDRGRRAGEDGFLPATSDPLSRWRRVENKTNDYLIDREVQRTRTFTGIPTIPLQDQAVTESMGAISNRSAEHLGTTDTMIIQVRRKLIEAAKALRDEGTVPPCVDEPERYGVRSASIVLPRDVDWTEATRHQLEAFTGLPVASA